jgi:outer membrane cobalamin receptor
VSAAQVDLPLSQATATVTVVSRAENEGRQLQTLGQALRAVPGLSIAQNGMLGSLTSLFTRGGESDFTLVLVDGMRANSFGGGVDLSQVPLVDAERIEIVRGPQSALFGSDAIGGVVQIVSRRDDRERLDASIEGGNFGSMRGRVGAGGSSKGWFAAAQGEHARTDGYRGLAPATGQRVTNDDGRVRHAGGLLGWRSPSGAEIRGHAQLSFTERGFPGAFGSNPIGAYTTVDRISRGENNRRQAGAQWLQPWTGRFGGVRQRTDFGMSDFDSDFVSPFGTSESETRRTTFRTQTDAALGPTFGLTGGVELLRERAGSTFITGSVFEPIPVKRFVGGYFGEARYSPASRWSLTGGVRVEQIRRDALPPNPSSFSPRPAFDDETITSVNPRIATAYVLRESADGSATRLHASAGTGIRPPDAFEIAFTDNPGLKPERSRSVDAGVLQTFARGLAAVEATAFFNNYDDLIVAVGRSFRDASRYRTDNISNARSRGLELSGSVRPMAALDIRASYTLLDTEILSVDRVEGQAPAPYRVGEALIRRPRNQGALTVLYAVERWTGFADAAFRGKVRDIEPTFGASGGVFDAKGFAAVNVGGAVRLVRGFELFARVENVADRHYEEAFGFPAPGRTGVVGVKFAASR